MTADRIVSLVPSVTETLLAWGVEPVAVTRFCEQPALLAVGGTKDPDLDAIGRLRPDLVVVNDEENRRADVDALVAAGWEVHVVHIESVADVGPALEGLAARLGLGVVVEAPVLPPPLGRRAFVPIWRRPWMTMNRDTYGSSLLEVLGIENVFADHGDRYPTVTLEEAVARHPDVVLAPSEPYPFTVRQEPELAQVAPVHLVDGQDLFWWGARTPAAVARLASALERLPPVRPAASGGSAPSRSAQ